MARKTPSIKEVAQRLSEEIDFYGPERRPLDASTPEHYTYRALTANLCSHLAFIVGGWNSEEERRQKVAELSD